MNKTLIFGITNLILLLIILPNVFSTIEPYYHPNNQQSNSHYYSILFDGEGEASAIAKLNILNSKKEPINNLILEIPGNQARIINILQEISNYETYCSLYSNNGKDCLNYATRKSYSPTYKILDYKKQITSNSIILDLNLVQGINSQESTSIIIYYKSEDYTKKEGNVFKIDFETIKTSYDTSLVQVGINVNEGLYLKEGKTQTNYQNNILASSNLLTKSSIGDYESRIINSNLYYIGQGSLVKTTYEIDPLESFTVNGRYSDSWLSLNIWKFLVVSLVSIIILGLIIIATIKSFNFIKKENPLSKTILTSLSLSFLNTLIWFLFILFIKYLFYDIFNYKYEFMVIVLGLLMLLFTIILLFGPTIYFATKYKPIYSVWYFASFLVFTIIFIIIGIIIVFAIERTLIYPYRPGYIT